MTAGNHQAQKRRLKLRSCNIICADMSLDVMHPDKRNSARKADCLCFRHSDKKRSYQSRTIGHRNCIQIRELPVCLPECLTDHLIHTLHVLSGSNFRHHSSVQGMYVYLGRNLIGQNRSSVYHNRRSRFITAGLNSQNRNIFFHLYASLRVPSSSSKFSVRFLPSLAQTVLAKIFRRSLWNSCGRISDGL